MEWSLFAIPYATLALAATVLAASGFMVVGRGHIMLALATSQSAAAGAATVMFVIGVFAGEHLHNDWRIHLGAVGGGLLCTALAWNGRHEHSALIFASASVVAVLCVAHSPYGMHDLLALQHSSALTAGLGSLWFFIVATAAMIVMQWWQHPTLRLLALDPQHASRCGINRRRWDIGIGMCLGVLLSMAVSTFGSLFTFVAILAPILALSGLVRSLATLLIVVPFMALICALFGIVLGHVYDVPPGQSVAAVMIASCLLTRLVSGLRRTA